MGNLHSRLSVAGSVTRFARRWSRRRRRQLETKEALSRLVFESLGGMTDFGARQFRSHASLPNPRTLLFKAGRRRRERVERRERRLPIVWGVGGGGYHIFGFGG